MNKSNSFVNFIYKVFAADFLSYIIKRDEYILQFVQFEKGVSIRFNINVYLIVSLDLDGIIGVEFVPICTNDYEIHI